MGEEGAAGGTVRYVDSSVERLQVKVTRPRAGSLRADLQRPAMPLRPTGTVGEFVAGVRYRAWQPPSALHPTIGVTAPLTFDLVDTWMNRSMGGCQYHVAHPGRPQLRDLPGERVRSGKPAPGALLHEWAIRRNESRCPWRLPNVEFPFTLDLRKSDSWL